MRSTTLNAQRALLPLIAFSTVATAFWRMPCQARSGLARIDPLVSPGTIGEHAHAIHGGSGFSESSDTAQLLSSECTSCEVSQDKSAYWTPAVYFKDAATGKFTLVDQVGGMLAYYLLFPNSGETTVEAFPKDFEMISGDTNQRNWSYPVPDVEKSLWSYTAPYNTQTFLRQAALGFNCLDYGKTPEPTLYRHSLPDKAYLDANCKDGVRFEIMFPSCWNGKDVTSKDKKSHVVFPDQVMTGNCPKDFPKRLPSILFETIWNTFEFAGKDGEFVIANGDTTGNGYHGDFVMGWDTAFLQKAVNQCTNPSGQISDCDLFDIQESSVYGNCNIAMPKELQSEDVLGPMPSLPGNVKVISGPGYAKGDSPGSSAAPAKTSEKPVEVVPATSAPVATYTPATTLPTGSQPTYGGIFAVKESSSASASVDVNIHALAMPTPSPSGTAAPPQSYYSTQYITNGNIVSEILLVEERVTVTASETSTQVNMVTHVQTNTVVAPPASVRRRAHMHRHQRVGR
ncbi:hypothetical protein BJ875DRAFT_169743 [Amylocarpus encephaloides]|uniref:DUF1996 domain-containing protein n=1 Tax=Amylocarpus encephaloides TaxID=45428 RepID=A0A9P7YB81_9HELO|nr:hypothetical protein BJ875DRAFT_169743 [Amylocarpus encephaloides]